MAINANVTLKKILTTVQSAATLTQVANWLYTSQPNVSKLLADAEYKYGVQLVNRQQSPIDLTPAGQQLLLRLDQILSLEENTLIELRNFQKSPVLNLKLAFFPTYLPILLPNIMRKVLALYPTLHVETKSLTTTKALEALKDGQVAIFIGRNASDPDIDSFPLFTEKLCFIVPQNSPLYQSGVYNRYLTNQDMVNLQKENYIKWATETSFIDVTEHFFTLNDLHFTSNLTVDTYEEAMLCATQGLGITMSMYTTAQQFLKDSQKINLLVIPEKMLSLEISIMTRNSVDPEIKKIVRTIAESLHA